MLLVKINDRGHHHDKKAADVTDGKQNSQSKDNLKDPHNVVFSHVIH